MSSNHQELDDKFFDCHDYLHPKSHYDAESPKVALGRLRREMEQCQFSDASGTDHSKLENKVEASKEIEAECSKSDGGKSAKQSLEENRPKCEDVVNSVFEEASSSSALDQFLEKNATAAENLDENSDFVLASEPGDPAIVDDCIARRESEDLLNDDEREALKVEATELKQSGNQLFAHGNYDEAVESYTKALDLCPLQFSKDRSIFFSNRAAARIKLDDWEAAASDCTSALELDPGLYKAYYRRACCYEKIEDRWDSALTDFQEVLKHDPGNEKAREAVMRLPMMINERNEKMKTEMFGKLKDLGDMVLRPFGLSTNNFELEQNDSGGYSIKMK